MAAMAAYRINFVDENNARRGFLSLLEHVADSRSTDADEHLDEIRAADGKKRHISFARDSTRQQRLAGAGRANHQHAFGNTATEFLKFFRITQELDQLLHFVLGFFYACHIAKRDLVFVTGEHPCLGFTEIKRTLASHPDLLPEQEIKD